MHSTLLDGIVDCMYGCQNTVQVWSHSRRILRACKETLKARVLWPVSWNHRSVLGMYFCALPRCSGWQWVYFSCCFSCVSRLVLVTVHFTQIAFLNPWSINCLSDAINKVGYYMKLWLPHFQACFHRSMLPTRVLNIWLQLLISLYLEHFTLCKLHSK